MLFLYMKEQYPVKDRNEIDVFREIDRTGNHIKWNEPDS